jgi:hypothetical protein
VLHTFSCFSATIDHKPISPMSSMKKLHYLGDLRGDLVLGNVEDIVEQIQRRARALAAALLHTATTNTFVLSLRTLVTRPHPEARITCMSRNTDDAVEIRWNSSASTVPSDADSSPATYCRMYSTRRELCWEAVG